MYPQRCGQPQCSQQQQHLLRPIPQGESLLEQTPFSSPVELDAQGGGRGTCYSICLPRAGFDSAT